MTRRICKECGRAAETEALKCELCGGDMIPAGIPKTIKPKKATKFSGNSDLGKESQGDFSPVSVRAIKPKVPHRTVLDIGRQEKQTFRQKLKTVGFIAGTIAIAFILAMSIRHFFGDYNVKFTDENVEKRQGEQMAD